jgi:WhiB family redox-sensing transcriptional regulator
MKFPSKLDPTEERFLAWFTAFDLPESFKGAACKGKNPRIFDSTHPAAVAMAKKICNTCPIKDLCLTWAISAGEAGIWGGTTEEERRSLSRKSQPIDVDELLERRNKRERIMSDAALAELAEEFSVTTKTIYRWRLQIQREAS